jgi:hypothetical protein
VNQATGDKATVEPNQPEQQQHYKNSPQHESYLLVSKRLESLSDWTKRIEPSVRLTTYVRSLLCDHQEPVKQLGYKRSSARTLPCKIVRISR